jgi:hypothetical protein
MALCPLFASSLHFHKFIYRLVLTNRYERLAKRNSSLLTCDSHLIEKVIVISPLLRISLILIFSVCLCSLYIIKHSELI